MWDIFRKSNVVTGCAHIWNFYRSFFHEKYSLMTAMWIAILFKFLLSIWVIFASLSALAINFFVLSMTDLLVMIFELQMKMMKCGWWWFMIDERWDSKICEKLGFDVDTRLDYCTNFARLRFFKENLSLNAKTTKNCTKNSLNFFSHLKISKKPPKN